MSTSRRSGAGSRLRRQNSALVADNHALESLLATCHIPALMLDRQMRLRRYTPPAERAFGLLASDLGRPLAGIKLHIESPQLGEAVRAVIGGVYLAKQIDARDRHGRSYALWVEPYKNGGRTIEGAVLTLSDITEKVVGLRALEASRDYADAIVDSVNNSIVVLNRHLKVRRASRFFHEFFQEPAQGLTGRSIYELGNGRWNIPPLRKSLSTLVANGTPFAGLEADFNVPKLGRRTLTISGRVIPHWLETDMNIVLAIEDVSLRRQAAEAVNLRRSEARQRDFVANISHELLTPITAIKGYAESLAMGAVRHSAKREKFVQIIERHADRLAQLVEDLLQLSSYDPGRTRHPPDAVSLWAAAETASREVAAAARKRAISVRLRISQRLRVAMSRSELVQVFQNICGNAVKYNRTGGRVYVTARRIGKRAVVSVQDTGMGIPAKDLPLVFDRFHRAANARANTAHGNGLGLSIARAILLQRGCRIWVESVEGKGSIFHFTLPLAAPARRRTAAPSASRGGRKGVTPPR